MRPRPVQATTIAVLMAIGALPCSFADKEPTQPTITWVKKVPQDQCTARATPGSIASILHKGFIHRVPKNADPGWNGKQIDANNEGEPLKFMVKQKQILRGMDIAIDGMCVGEKVTVIIPPKLAFDDSEMDFKWQNGRRPAPEGATLRYEIELVAVEAGRANMKSSEPRPGSSNTQLLVALGVLFVIIFGLVFGVLRTSQSKSKGKPGKEKKKRK